MKTLFRGTQSLQGFFSGGGGKSAVLHELMAFGDSLGGL